MALRHLLPLALILASPAAGQSQRVYYYDCDLGGAPAQLVMEVTVQGSYGINSTIGGDITGVTPTGTSLYTAGTVTSQVAQYSFTGENTFADFLDHTTGERFRVQWQQDDARGGIWMIVNPFGGGGSTPYFCRLQGVQ